VKCDLSRAANRVAEVWIAVAILFYSISGLAYLYFGSVSVFYSDLWQFYRRCLTLSWLRFALARWNDHPLVFPSLLWVVDLHFLRGKQAPFILLGIVLTIATTLILLVPIWRDKAVGTTSRMLAALIVVMSNFWLGRDTITAIGFSNCITYLVLVGVAVTALALPKLRSESPHFWTAAVAVLIGGFVASFSFGTGAAVWPALLLLAWAARLGTRSLVVLLIYSIIAVVLMRMLPLPPDQTFYSVRQLVDAAAAAPVSMLSWLCRLIGSPVAYVIAGWVSQQSPSLIAESSISLWIGVAGLVLAIMAAVGTLIPRDIGQTGLKFTGLALMSFSLFAAMIIIIGRAPSIRTMPSEAAAPRYFFWSTLFWSGFLLLILERGAKTRYLRWPIFVIVLAIPILAWPSHFSSAVGDRFLRVNCEVAATSLIDGVRDVKQLSFLDDPERFDSLVPLLRSDRLDMFADGFQDWIGLNETTLFGGKHKPEKLKGQCSIDALLQCDNGAPAARVVGQAIEKRRVNPIIRWAITPVSWIFGQEIKKGDVTPKTWVIVDPAGVIRGVARASPVSPFIDRVFYHGKLNTTGFVGYIRDYNPELKYVVRSADGVLSDEKIPVQIPVTGDAKL
jgi:hypothetical protein